MDTEGCVHYRFTGLDNEADVWEDVRGVLERCRDGAHTGRPVSIVVLPELCVTPTMDERLGTNCQAAAFCANSRWVVCDRAQGQGSSYFYLPIREGLVKLDGEHSPDQPALGHRTGDGLIFDMQALREL